MEVHSRKSLHASDSALVFRNDPGISWRPSSFANIASDILRRPSPVLSSQPKAINHCNQSTQSTPEHPVPPEEPSSNGKVETEVPVKKNKVVRNTIVNIVIVEARGLPASPDDGFSHAVYCKFRLGSHTYKSKSVLATRQPQWRERFKLNLSNDQLLNLSVWNKGKQKNFMGSCVIDLSSRERERTHDIWQELDGGYGSVHLSVTMCCIRKTEEVANAEPNVEDLRSKYAFYNLSTDIQLVGQLHVKVIDARGLYGRPNAYCTLELDNEKIRTPTVNSSAEPVWNKNYVFNIYDVTSTLELKVSDSSLNSLLNDFLGRVPIPLLKINNGEVRWYALKDNSKRKSARGNCPRVRLEMNIFWNPVIASLKLFRPKQVKYISKPPKFSVSLVYKNVKFIKETFEFLACINDRFKRLFEWDDREYSTTVLSIWLTFWYFFQLWMTPLLIILVFPTVHFIDQMPREEKFMRTRNVEDLFEHDDDNTHNGETVTEKIKGLPEMTFTITDGIEYMVSVAERLHNLVKFKVPFLSYLTILLLIVSSAVLYCIPFNYLMMGFGLYKYARKRYYPDRVLNNDLLDFISRIPDNKILRDWRELHVPEPNQQRHISTEVISTVHQ